MEIPIITPLKVELEEAKKRFESCSYDLGMRTRYADLLKEAGMVSEALAVYEGSLALFPDDIESLSCAALLYRSLPKGFARCRELTCRALESYRENRCQKGLEFLAQALLFEGEAGLALETAQKAVETSGSANSYAVLGAVTADKGDHQEALRLYKKAHEADPTDHNVLYWLTFILFESGLSEEAGKYSELRRKIEIQRKK